MEVKGKMICKKSDNKAFKLGDDWYNVNTPVIPFLEKINKGDEIVVTFEKKGVARYVSKLVAASEAKEEVVEEAPKSSGGFTCKECGKELKNNKYELCWACNKKASSGKKFYPKKESKFYDNPEKTAQIQRGNALNAAAMVASSQTFEDPEIAQQFTLILADDFLTWLRAE